MHTQEKQIPIWFFIGALLAIYGVIIAVHGVATWSEPPPAKMPEQIYKLHAPIWWGALMVALGAVYLVKFWPSKPETLTGERQPRSTKDFSDEK